MWCGVDGVVVVMWGCGVVGKETVGGSWVWGRDGAGVDNVECERRWETRGLGWARAPTPGSIGAPRECYRGVSGPRVRPQGSWSPKGAVGSN